MGMFSVTFQLEGGNGGQRREFQGTVDTGSTYTMVPTSILEQMGIRRANSYVFEYADGRVERQYTGPAVVIIDDNVGGTTVTFGPEDVEPILGVHALEALGLVVDPINKRLAHVSRLRI